MLLHRWAFASLVTLAGCTSLGGGPQDNLLGGWDPSQWTDCRSLEDQDLRLFLCVPPGETHKDWTRLLLLRTMSRASQPLTSAEMVAAEIDQMTKDCRTFVPNVISRQTEPQGDLEQSILLEAEQIGCHDYTDGDPIHRILYGRFTVFKITYHARTRETARAHRDEWIKQLSEATIVSGP